MKNTIVFALAILNSNCVIENVIFYGIYLLLSPFFRETVGGITHLRARCACSFDSSPLTRTWFANTVEFCLKSVQFFFNRNMQVPYQKHNVFIIRHEFLSHFAWKKKTRHYGMQQCLGASLDTKTFYISLKQNNRR